MTNQDKEAIAHDIVQGIKFRLKPMKPSKVIAQAIAVHGEATEGAIAAVLRHEYVTPPYDSTWRKIMEAHGSILCAACHRILRRRVDGAISPIVRHVYAVYRQEEEAAA